MREVVYSTKPLKIRDLILWQGLIKGEYDKMAEFMVARTDLTMEEVLELDVEDLTGLLVKMGEAIQTSQNLMQIGKQLDA